MAENEIEMTLKWENGVNFTMTSKVGSGSITKVVETDENNHIADTWENIAGACKIYFDKKLKAIGDEMKA